MKKLLNLIIAVLPLCACAGMSSFDGNSTKTWVTIESSKQNLQGKTIDVCYRFDVRFSPEEALQRFDSDKACITKCCWYSDTKQVVLHLNADFAKDLAQTRQANKYTLDTLTFNVRYSNLLNTIHASVSPSSVLRYDGLIKLDYSTVNDDQGLIKNTPLGNLKVKKYPDDQNGHEGTYLYKDQEKAMAKYDAAAKELREMAEYQKVDTGKTPGEIVIEKTNVNPQGDQGSINDQKTVIAKLQNQKSLDEAQRALENQNTKTQNNVNSFYGTQVYDLDSPAQRKAFMENKTIYERAQAVDLLKQFYEQNIDKYIHKIDKEKAAKGYVLLANDRELSTTKTGKYRFRIACNVNGQIGKNKNKMKPYPIPCGVYEVNINKKSVSPQDTIAITIVNKDYLH